MKNQKSSLSALVAAMLIFGTVGLFRRYIPLPSGLIALARGGIGMLVLVLTMLIGRRRADFSALKRNLPFLLISGVLLGANWIFFFEAQMYTTVAAATVCYYLAPVLVLLAAPLVLKEKMTLKRLLCVAVAFVGVVLVSGLLHDGGAGGLRGVLLALVAAVLYAGIVLLNKKMQGIGVLERTVLQLGVSAVTLVPYVLLAEPVFETTYTPVSILMLLVIGVVHTGLAYALYFGAVGKLRAESAALCSYIDPAVAVLLSAIVLQEQIGPFGYIGAALVLGAALVGESAWPKSKQ